MDKKKLLVISFLALIICVVTIIISLKFTYQPTTSSEIRMPTASIPTGNAFPKTATPVVTQIQPVTPTVTDAPTQSPQTNPPVNYNQKENDRLQQKIDHRISLSQSDEQIKAKLTNAVDESEFLHQGDGYQIDYVQAADLFQVEIQTIDYQKVKTASLNWLLSQGLSKDGICNLPVMYYFNFAIANQIRSKNIQFSPLPDGC